MVPLPEQPFFILQKCVSRYIFVFILWHKALKIIATGLRYQLPTKKGLTVQLSTSSQWDLLHFSPTPVCAVSSTILLSGWLEKLKIYSYPQIQNTRKYWCVQWALFSDTKHVTLSLLKSIIYYRALDSPPRERLKPTNELLCFTTPKPISLTTSVVLMSPPSGSFRTSGH